MLPDEILRMDNRECLVLLRGEKPLRLYKIIPDEHPSFGRLTRLKSTSLPILQNSSRQTFTVTGSRPWSPCLRP